MIVKSILDTDLYKFTTSYACMKLFPQARGTFEFFDRDLDPIGAKDYATVDDILSRFIPFENFRKSYDSAGQIMHPHDEMAESDCWSQSCARHGEDVVNKVWSRHLASEFKRKKAPIYIFRELYE